MAKETKKADSKKDDKPKASAKADSKKEDSQSLSSAHVVLLPVKAVQERLLFSRPFSIRRNTAGNISVKGEIFQVEKSGFNPETKRFEHVLAEKPFESAEQAKKELEAKGWVLES